MTRKLRLLAVLAHPDDESLGFGGTLARYAAEGVETYLITATRGERGRSGRDGNGADPAETGRVRETELKAAAQVLGIREVAVLGYPDGAVDKVGADVAIREIAAHIRRIRPDAIITFGPDGAYGHPDHIAISQFATASALRAAECEGHSASPHRVSKLYYLAWGTNKWAGYEAAFRKLTSMVDGVQRQASPWPDWAITTGIDTSDYWPIVWKAVCCHQTQISIYERLSELTEEQHKGLWGSQEFYRAFSSVNGGRELETDLFEGLR
jgi:LmbE family N-acetylglucosaminyl deacetylase